MRLAPVRAVFSLIFVLAIAVSGIRAASLCQLEILSSAMNESAQQSEPHHAEHSKENSEHSQEVVSGHKHAHQHSPDEPGHEHSHSHPAASTPSFDHHGLVAVASAIAAPPAAKVVFAAFGPNLFLGQLINSIFRPPIA